MAPLFSLSMSLNLYIKLTVDELVLGDGAALVPVRVPEPIYIKLTVDELVLGDGATLVLVQGPEQVHGPLPEKHVAYNNK